MISDIVWAGFLSDPTGYGQVSRNYVKGFKRIGFPIHVVEFDKLEMTVNGKNPVFVIHGMPDLFNRIKSDGNHLRVGCTIFETDRIPDSWVAYCNSMDMVCVPSHFNYDGFSNSGVYSFKLRVMPYGVDTEMFYPVGLKRRDGPFNFLYVSNFNYRKGFDLLIESYLNEFSDEDNVLLTLRTNATINTLMESVKDKVNLKRDDLPPVEVIDKFIDDESMKYLYSDCDLYISTDRANGWGMPCMEAMACGKPAATINWSGSTEFMNEKNSLLIPTTGRMVPIDKRWSDSHPNLKGFKWAEVSVKEVQKVMRFAYDNPDRLKEIADNGLKDIQEHYTVECMAQRMAGGLEKYG